MSSREKCAEVEAKPTEPGGLDLWERIREDWITTGRDWTRPGFRALAVYRLGAWRLQLGSHFLRRLLWPIYQFLYRYVRNHYGIEINYRSKIGRRVNIAHQHGIVIHRSAEIGDDCLIRHGVTIGAPNHSRGGEAPKIGRRVEIGVGAVIAGEITIGDEARIGPNAVLMTNVPAGASVFGNPARIIPPRQATETQEGAKDLASKVRSAAPDSE